VADVTKTIISRIQQRRGLKQDLPQPLRPGELGFTTDTNQLYIGADPSSYYNTYNKISRVEQVAGAALALNSITAIKLITFKVPFKQFTVTTTGTTNFDWPVDDVNVFGTRSKLNLYSNASFTAATVSVFKTGNRQSGDTTLPYSVAVDLTKDFKFNGAISLSNHYIKFRTAPGPGDLVTVCYYNNSAILDAITQSGLVTLPSISAQTGFYDNKNIPPSLYLDPKLVTVSETSGRGFIGLEDRHLLPFTHAQPTANTGLNLGNLIVQSSTIPGVNTIIVLGAVNTLANLVTVVNNANTFIKMERDLSNTLYITLREEYYTQANTSFVLREDASALATLGFGADIDYTPEDNSVKSHLETWLVNCIDDAELNIFTSATVNQAWSTSGIDTDVNLYQVDALADPLELSQHATKEETQAFNQVVNGVYVMQDIATNRTGIVNIKTNIEIPTELTITGATAGTTFTSPLESIIFPGLNQIPGFALSTDPYDTYILEYSVSVQSGSPSAGNYQRVGTMMLSGRGDIDSVAFTDTSTEINQDNGILTFSASLDGSDNIILTALSTLSPLTFRYIFRRWQSL
jgi:hypothetical protein